MLAALPVEISHDWLDYLTAFAALFAAFGTIAAVIWAIFGPDLRAARRRPLLELVNEGEGTEAFFEADDPEVSDGVALRLKNAAGRETATGVEVFLSVFAEMPEMADADGALLEVPIVSDANLNFDGNDGHYGRAEATVPPAVSRRVYLARLGDPQKLFDSWYPIAGAREPEQLARMCGAWATVPARQDALDWLADGSEYPIVLTVAGQNFDALHFQARVKATRTDLKEMELMKMTHPINISFEWLEALQPAT